MVKMKQILITMLLLLGAISISAQTSTELSKQEQYRPCDSPCEYVNATKIKMILNA